MTDIRRTRTLILNEGDPEQKRVEIRNYYHQTVEIEEKLIVTLRNASTYTMRADPLRHPLIFYFGHTAAFFMNKLILARMVNKRINPVYESLFAVGVDEMSWDDLNEEHYDWPSRAEVQRYRDQVRELVDGVISTMELRMPVNWDNLFWVIMMGIEHARIHLETSSVLIRQLPVEELIQDPFWELCPHSGNAPDNELVSVTGGKVRQGKKKDHPLYGWDNEFGEQVSEVSDFRASKYLVSNQEFFGFVEDDGYKEKKWWTDEGWQWREYRQSQYPLFWRKDESGEYRLRVMLEIIEMPWDWPVEVNYLEAKAFCNWKSKKCDLPIRLPSEEEWYRLHDLSEIADQPYWNKAPGNINLEHYCSSCPVSEFSFGEIYDVIGNVWQWTETPISGFSGFEVHPYYDDFSTPTFDTRHNLIKGGSWISTGNEAIRDSRYAFRRHFYQHAGFRYIESSQPVVVRKDVYESDPAVTLYCEFHWGQEYFGVANYSKRCVELIREVMKGRRMGRSLDIGCAVGRTTFEFTRDFEHVTGLDFSARFIRIAVDLMQKGCMQYERVEEGELVTYHEVRLEDLGLEECRDRVEFYQADACNLKELYRDYDLIFAGNLIDRLYSPRKFLQMIHERLHLGGVLVLTSPYSWDIDHTERDEWLGGFRKDGEPYGTLEAFSELLGEHFTQVGAVVDIPFVIRETKRKFQHSIAEMTVWERVR